MGTQRNIRDDEEVAIVFTFRLKIETFTVTPARKGEEYVNVGETMHTPFHGPDARARAENFRASEQERDFTEADGWQWWIWSSKKANEVYGKSMTRALLGED